jgi:hypothetical protein
MNDLIIESSQSISAGQITYDRDSSSLIFEGDPRRSSCYLLLADLELALDSEGFVCAIEGAIPYYKHWKLNEGEVSGGALQPGRLRYLAMSALTPGVGKRLISEMDANFYPKQGLLLIGELGVEHRQLFENGYASFLHGKLTGLSFLLGDVISAKDVKGLPR